METEKIENMLSQLNKMVETMHSEQQEMKHTMQNMDNRMDNMELDIQNLDKKIELSEETSEKRHKEMIERLSAIENDQDFIWEKAVRNERELANLKKQLT